MVAILRWLPELLQRSGIMPHLDPSWRIWQICINAVRPRRPRHGRHQNLEPTIYLFFDLGLPPEMLYITLKILIYYLIKQRQAFFSGAGSSSPRILISLKRAAWRAESSGSQFSRRLALLELTTSSSCLPPGSTPHGSQLLSRSQSCRRS